jgi:hypothetical protein
MLESKEMCLHDQILPILANPGAVKPMAVKPVVSCFNFTVVDRFKWPA